jgi:hypothetical protein
LASLSTKKWHTCKKNNLKFTDALLNILNNTAFFLYCRCNSFKSLLLDVYVGSTCFGRLHVHHQELTTALIASGWSWSGRL